MPTAPSTSSAAASAAISLMAPPPPPTSTTSRRAPTEVRTEDSHAHGGYSAGTLKVHKPLSNP